MTDAEYLGYDLANEGLHELVDGELHVRELSSLAHVEVLTALVGLLGEALRGSPHKGLGPGMRIHVPEAALWAYPDLVAFTRPSVIEPTEPESLLNPRVLFEVMSATSERYDRGVKLTRYRRSDSVHEIVLVDPVKQRVEHYRRLSASEWRITDLTEGDLVLESIGATLPLAAIFEDLPPQQ